ncbi:FMN-binding protein [Arenibacter sp. H213]|nr:FMN-binding protein [Arenibacter sp. H213]
MHRIKIISLLLFIALALFGYGLPEHLQKKVGKEIEKVFGSSTIVMNAIKVSVVDNAELPTKITTDNFFKLEKGTEFLGYIYVGNAPSKTATFDYLVVFDTDLTVIHSKILIYREEYGGEIGSKRWLQQFIGKTSSDRVDHNSNIDGISGATISVRSMTMAMDNLLQTIAILKNKNLL